MLVPHNHRYWLEKGGRWEFFWISMNGEEALRIHQIDPGDCRAGAEAAAGDDRSSCRLQPAADQGRGRRRALPRPSPMRRRWRFTTTSSARMPFQPTRPSAMQQVIDHIKANLDKPLPVERAGRGRRPEPRAFLAHALPRAKACRRPNSCCSSGCSGRPSC